MTRQYRPHPAKDSRSSNPHVRSRYPGLPAMQVAPLLVAGDPDEILRQDWSDR